MTRQRISSGGPFEKIGGYSRAVRVGDHIYVSGSTAVKDGKVVGPGDVAAQTRQTLSTISDALEHAGATLEDVVRYRIYLTNIADSAQVLPIFGEYFGEIRPAGTLVAVSALIAPEMMIEVEVDAIAGSASTTDD
ncbi:MAG TPA: RidA family protein [Thermomicrobiales bacterium]|nr:RidA family protein [Thermomicrobiales bacterium]